MRLCAHCVYTRRLHLSRLCLSPLNLAEKKTSYFLYLSDLPHLSLSLEMLGKYGLTTASSMMFAYTTELYPTPLRNTATGATGTISRLGSCLAPPLLKLSAMECQWPEILHTHPKTCYRDVSFKAHLFF